MSAFLITFTPAAITHIQSILSKHPQGVFRLSVKQTGCSGYMYQPTVIDAPEDGDVIGYQDTDFVAYVDASMVSILANTVIDFVDKGFGMKQLVYNNPQADGLCGCGESFHLKSEASE